MKVDGSLGSLAQGVSQQPPAERRLGQHGAQVNMIADPVRGLVRRHGSLWQSERDLSLSSSAAAANVADTASWRTFDYTAGGRDLTVMYRSGARASGANLPVVLVYDKTNNQFLTLSRNTVDALLDTLESGGVSAITAVGKYVFFAGNTITPAGSSTYLWGSVGNQGNTVAWVRGGAYSRTYKITVVKTDNTSVTFSYTTPSSSYGGTLDTSAILTSDPDYVKKVTDLQSAFNTVVTNWIGTSAAAIQPEAIAASLVTAAAAAGLAGVSRASSTVVFTDIKAISTSDSGDGSLLKGLASEAVSVNDLTDAHFVGKIVRIKPGGGESFYMRAAAKNPLLTSGVVEALWVEGGGIQHTVTSALCMGVASGGTFYLASSAALLNVVLPGSHPTYADSTVGDNDSSPIPHFIGKKITYLGVFQDRLLIGSEAVLRASKVGDYLNFFRSSVLTVASDDPLEFLSQGSEDDVLKHSVLYDRDLYLFGRRQYAVSGRVPLTPSSANMPVVSSHAGADVVPPKAAGGLIFYAKTGQDSVGVFQIEPGRNAESPESFSASSQLDDYLIGQPIDLNTLSKPSTLIVRTSGARNTLFIYSYLDTNERRLQDCWHRWDYAPILGPILGTSASDKGLLVFTLRIVADASAVTRHYAVCDLQALDTQVSKYPYLDSMRPHASVVGSPGSLHLATTGFAAAYDDQTDEHLLGVNDSSDTVELAQLIADAGHSTGLTLGAPYPAYWQPTNPSQRDDNGKSITAGRLVVTRLSVAFTGSSGFRSVVTAFGADATFTFNGRVLGDVNNVIGRVPITAGVQSIPVGRGSRDYSQTIHALTWLPMNLTAVDWVGQLFNRPQRVG